MLNFLIPEEVFTLRGVLLLECADNPAMARAAVIGCEVAHDLHAGFMGSSREFNERFIAT